MSYEKHPRLPYGRGDVDLMSGNANVVVVHDVRVRRPGKNSYYATALT